MAPKIDRKNLQKRKVKLGSPLKLEADVKGEPEPTITWTLNRKELKSDGRLTIENKDYHTSFVMEKTTRADTGKFFVVVIFLYELSASIFLAELISKSYSRPNQI